MFFMKEYQSNSHAGFYTKWILIFVYYLSWPRAGSRSRNLDISAPAPAPAKSSGSMRLRLHNTDSNTYYTRQPKPPAHDHSQP